MNLASQILKCFRLTTKVSIASAQCLRYSRRGGSRLDIIVEVSYMRKVVFLGTLFALALSFGLAQETGGTQTGGTQSGGAEVGNVAESGLILISTRDPGSYIATADGMALYTLVDENGEVLPCEGECLQNWPPYTGEATADEGTGLDPSLVGTVETEGGQQVTYNDYPLYTFTGDQSAADVTGQAVEGFGGFWYVLSEDGDPLVQEETTAE